MTTVATEGSPCPYCGSAVTFRESSAFIYAGTDYGPVYACSAYPRCDAFVGCHRGTREALGRLADRELRTWKKRAHAAFDPLWQARQREIAGERDSKQRARGGLYGWLARALGIPSSECHIGMFSVETCKRVVALCAPHADRLLAGEKLGRLE